MNIKEKRKNRRIILESLYKISSLINLITDKLIELKSRDKTKIIDEISVVIDNIKEEILKDSFKIKVKLRKKT